MGRFMTVDPLAEKFPWQSPYCYAANNPVRFIDRKGENATEPERATAKTTAIDNTAYKVKTVIKPIVITNNRKINMAKTEVNDQPKSEIVAQTTADAKKSFNSLSDFDKQMNQSLVVKSVGTGMLGTAAVIAAPEVASFAKEVATSPKTINTLLDIYNVGSKAAPLLPVGEGVLKAVLNAPPDTPYLINNEKYITTVDFFNSIATIYKDNIDTK